MTESTCTTDKYGIKRWHNAKNILHNEEGPAFEDANEGVKEWWLEGNNVTEREHRVLVQGPPYANLHEYRLGALSGRHKNALILIDNDSVSATDTHWDGHGSIDSTTDLLKDMGPREMLMQALTLLGLKYEDI